MSLILTSDGLWTSPDGLTWTLRQGALPYHGYQHLALDGNRFIASTGSSLAFSSNGLTWNAISLQSAPYGRITPITGGLLVAHPAGVRPA